MSHRFFVDAAGLSADQRRQIATVLRLAPGDRITLVRAGEEVEWLLTAVSTDAVEGDVVAQGPAALEPRFALLLALPLLKGDRSEEVVEAASQLGVARFLPFASSRSVVRELSAAKRVRWERIAREAAETAKRGMVPAIDEPREWPTLIAALPPPVIVAWEEEHERSLESALAPSVALSLVIGPEGGFTAEEIALARASGATIVSLGRRTLRAETAAIAAVARVVARLDDP